MSEPVSKKARIHESSHGKPVLITFGESMIRFQPIDDESSITKTRSRHLPQPFLRSIGGDELNVAVATSLLGVKARWVSVVPAGPLGDVITDSCAHHEVEFVGPRPAGDVGIFTVLPELQTVHYQRQHSAFALQDPNCLDWREVLKSSGQRAWLHVTGITPLVSPSARQSWDRAVQHSLSCGIPVSLDLNHRKQLGTLENLWKIVSPHCQGFEFIILSMDQLNGLAALEIGPLSHELTSDSDDALCFGLMRQLQEKWRCKRIVVCRKTRDSGGLQCRWSLLTEMKNDSNVIVECSTRALPVLHIPKDECGGGSAWAAGLIHALHVAPISTLSALRRADLLSALCQETVGDFSRVSGDELRAAEQRFADVEARLLGTPSILQVPAVFPNDDAAKSEIETTLGLLKAAGVLPILRAKGSPEVAVKRGIELASMGCRAMEVTLDSSDWQSVLAGLRSELPPQVALGIGTVMDDSVKQLRVARSLGATFALSPIDPIGFVEECQKLGVLAIPSAFTSNECWALHRRGVRLIKLFHAGLASPAILKSMLDVTPLGANLNICPSGGVSPGNALQWLDAGAAVVGMGSNLVGKDIATKLGTEAHTAAVADWETSGKALAENLFKQVEAYLQRKSLQ